MLYHGENDGAVALRDADGGNGNDSIRATLTEDAGSTGQLAAQEHGSNGNDTMALFINSAKPPVLAWMDGGAGLDTHFNTANVTWVNFP
jgi:hypothetical protein